GLPSSTGKIVLLSIGASAQSQEWCGKPRNCTTPLFPAFMTFAASNTSVNHSTLVIVNGAQSGTYARLWADPVDLSSKTYGLVKKNQLAPLGLTEAQVQLVWLEDADQGPTVSLPNPAADAYTLENWLAGTVKAIRIRYPNVRMVFLSSRIYAGYAKTLQNPEPYAYESGFSVKWLIQAQINQMR